MALTGLRNGAGGSGVAFLDFRGIVSASIFGSASTADGRAVAACTVIPGVPHFPFRDEASAELRLVTLDLDGRAKTVQDGPGRGLWFDARDNHNYALALRAGRFILVQHWGTQAWTRQIADTQAANRALATDINAGQFWAGINFDGALILMARRTSGALRITRSGVSKLNWLTRPSSPVPSLGKRLVFRERDRMLVLSNALRGRPRTRVPAVRSFRIRNTTLDVDTAWGTNGTWTGPQDFSPTDLLIHPDGSFICVGWSAIPAGVTFTAIRIASDGQSDTFYVAPSDATQQPHTFEARIDSEGGLLLATTIPNPLSIFGPGGPPLAFVAHWDENAQPDTTFGNQGICWASYFNYPIVIRGLMPTARGFFVAAERTLSVDSQYLNTIPAIFSFDPTGRAINGFGETGVIQHDDVAAVFQIHDSQYAYAAGKRRLVRFPAADEFHLAVTRVGAQGFVSWWSGTTNGLNSAPLVIAGQRAEGFSIKAFVRWGNLLAIAGSTPNFVTIRNADGSILGPGVVTTLQVGDVIESIQPLVSGELEVTYTEGPLRKRRRLLSTPSLVFDPNFQPVIVPDGTGPQLILADGSAIQPRARLVPRFFPPDELLLWLIRVLPDGTIDPAFGGGSASPQPGTAGTINTTAFSRISYFDAAGFLTLPDGRFIYAINIYETFPNDPLERVPMGVIVTSWLPANGAPDPAWGPAAFISPEMRPATHVRPDNPDRLLLIGSAETATTRAKTAAIQRIRTTDGMLDPGFGMNGLLRVSLRGDENKTAQPAIDQPGGGILVPVVFGYKQDRSDLSQTFAWLDIT